MMNGRWMRIGEDQWLWCGEELAVWQRMLTGGEQKSIGIHWTSQQKLQGAQKSSKHVIPVPTLFT